MSVHNGEKYLTDAIESILNQTAPHFFFLIINDASTDATSVILNKYAAQDARITILTNEIPLGLTVSLNRGIEQIVTPYVARMDADDVSLPERLEKQLAHMEAHPGTVALGGWVDPIDAKGQTTESPWFAQIRQYLDSVDICKALLLGYSIIVHPTVMLRTDTLRAIGGYRACFRYAQDYDLWLRLLPEGKLQVLPEALLRYRIHSHALSATKLHEQRIANSAAFSSALIRERGEADPLQGYNKCLDYSQMERLADMAGPIAWLRWLELNSHVETDFMQKDLHAINERIISLYCHEYTDKNHMQRIDINSLWIEWLQKKIISLQNQNMEQQNYINDIEAQISSYKNLISCKIYASLRKMISYLRAIKRLYPFSGKTHHHSDSKDIV
jgi:glycosyltransferase involved in cell wall biosynthesis